MQDLTLTLLGHTPGVFNAYAAHKSAWRASPQQSAQSCLTLGTPGAGFTSSAILVTCVVSVMGTLLEKTETDITVSHLSALTEVYQQPSLRAAASFLELVQFWRGYQFFYFPESHLQALKILWRTSLGDGKDTPTVLTATACQHTYLQKLG